MTTTTPARETTDWFPADVKPVHPGIYEKLNTSTNIVFYSEWTGYNWLIGAIDIRVASKMTSTAVRIWPWRGLKEQA